MNILIQKFTNKPQDLRSHLCPEDYVSSLALCPVHVSFITKVCDREANTRPGLCVRWKERKKGTTCLVRSHSSYLHPFPSYNFPIACPVLMAALATKHFQSEISSIKFLQRSGSPITRCCQHSDRSDLLCSICSPS